MSAYDRIKDNTQCLRQATAKIKGIPLMTGMHPLSGNGKIPATTVNCYPVGCRIKFALYTGYFALISYAIKALVCLR